MDTREEGDGMESALVISEFLRTFDDFVRAAFGVVDGVCVR